MNVSPQTVQRCCVCGKWHRVPPNGLLLLFICCYLSNTIVNSFCGTDIAKQVVQQSSAHQKEECIALPSLLCRHKVLALTLSICLFVCLSLFVKVKGTIVNLN